MTMDGNMAVPNTSTANRAIPEGGQFRPGVENILYVLASYPDGSPAEADLTIWHNGNPVAASTGGYGLAEVRFTPADPYVQISIQAQDRQGRRGIQDEAVSVHPDPVPRE